MIDDPDWADLQAWCDGDEARGDELLRRHFEEVYGFLRTKVEPEAAEDLTQTTFEGLTGHKDRVRPTGSFRAYLLSIARHKLLDHLRRGHRHAARFDPLTMTMRDLGTTPSRHAARVQERKRLLDALDAIPIDLRLTVELSYWHDLPVREVAEAMKVPEGTVKTRLRRARQLLAEALQQAGLSEEESRRALASLDG